MHLCLSLLHWPFQPEPWRKYLSTVTTCTAQNSSLKKITLQEETFKTKKFQRFQQVRNLGINDSRLLTSSYTASYWMTPRMQPPSEERLLDSTRIRLCRHYIIDHMMKFYSTTFHTKRHRRHSGKFMVVCEEHANPDLSSETDFETWLLLAKDNPWRHHLC